MNIFKFKPITHKTFEFKRETPPEKLPETDTQNISYHFKENLENIQSFFSLPKNSDIKLRSFKTGDLDAFIVFIENMSNTDFIDKTILAPLMLLKNSDISLNKIKDTLIVHNQVTTLTDFKLVLRNINLGDCVLFVDGINHAISLDVKNWVKRGIEPPVSESVVYGPHEGFTENFKTNIAMIRKGIRNENLIAETLFLGSVSQTPCSILYIKNILNPALLKEIKYRLENIGADYITQTGELEQYIEDSTLSLVPQMLTTERPDKAVTSLIEGKIVLILQGSPFALVLPVTISEFLTTVEDKYVRFPFALLMKTIRLIGIISSVLLSGLYISIVNFHQEMIPPGLLLSLEAAREAVPFSSLTELLLMEIAFDIIREASIRVPSPIGSTLGIIGGLIVGQAAVSANLVSPMAIIIVAITGIGSFATPNYALNFSFRFSRYLYIAAGAIGGFYAISVLLFINACHLCSIKSLGVPLFTSLSTNSKQSVWDFMFPKPIFKREVRHEFLNPRLKKTQDNISRGWDK